MHNRFTVYFIHFRQLSDITRDGALSLAEFKIAMHLVVLKRNGIALPNALPPSLVYTVPVTIPSTSPSNAELSLSPQSKGKEVKFVDRNLIQSIDLLGIIIMYEFNTRDQFLLQNLTFQEIETVTDIFQLFKSYIVAYYFELVSI